jgi:cell division GTPase FtsZ
MTIAFLGIGGAGGNLADLASERGSHSVAINFSQGDLNSIENVKYKLKLIGSDGAGHDRNLAIELMSQHYDMAINFVKDHFDNESNQIIFVTFSCGGGTGSGVSPILLDLLSATMPDKTFVAIPILPDKNESLTAQINTLQVFEELSRLDICVLPIDNQQAREIYKVTSKKDLYQISNELAIQSISNLISYTEQYSQYGTFDKRDLNSSLKIKGIATIAEIDLMEVKENKSLTKGIVTESIHQSWYQSIFAPIETKQIIKAAVIFDGDKHYLHAIDYKCIFELFDNQFPIDLFEGIYEFDDGKIITLLTGLSWCETRLKQIEDIIQTQQRTIEHVLSKNETTTYKPTVSNILTKINKQPKKKESPLDILSKYKRQ